MKNLMLMLMLMLILIIASLIISIIALIRTRKDRYQSSPSPSGSWTTLQPLKSARAGFGVAVIPSDSSSSSPSPSPSPSSYSIYAIGGVGSTGVLLSSTEMYNTVTKSWAPSAKLDVGLSFFDAAVLKPQYAGMAYELFIMGGYSGAPISGPRITAHMYMYTQGNYRWSPMKVMLTPRVYHRACVLETPDNSSYIFVIGGHTKTGSSKWSSRVDMYDRNEFQWKQMANLTHGRQSPGVFTYNNTLYVIGGNDEKGFVPYLETYAGLTDDSWGKPIPTTNIGLTSSQYVVVKDKLYILGGVETTTNQITKDVYSLDLKTLSSSSLKLTKESFSLPAALIYFGAVAINNSIYIIGGSTSQDTSDGGSVVSSVYRIDLYD